MPEGLPALGSGQPASRVCSGKRLASANALSRAPSRPHLTEGSMLPAAQPRLDCSHSVILPWKSHSSPVLRTSSKMAYTVQKQIRNSTVSNLDTHWDSGPSEELSAHSGEGRAGWLDCRPCDAIRDTPVEGRGMQV